MDSAPTTSAGQEKIDKFIQTADDSYNRMLSNSFSLVQKPRWQRNALVFLQKREEVAVGLL